MATWAALKTYLEGAYGSAIVESAGEAMSLELAVGSEDRTQLVFVSHFTLMDGSEHWVAIESPVGEVEEVDLKTAALASRAVGAGGISVLQRKYVTLRHTLPLEHFDLNEFERPFQLVINGADEIERRLLDGDSY
jgi:hypothetical protein